jgi:hypothetical protein
VPGSNPRIVLGILKEMPPTFRPGGTYTFTSKAVDSGGIPIPPSAPIEGDGFGVPNH